MALCIAVIVASTALIASTAKYTGPQCGERLSNSERDIVAAPEPISN
jgi:hypothetical protein